MPREEKLVKWEAMCNSSNYCAKEVLMLINRLDY